MMPYKEKVSSHSQTTNITNSINRTFATIKVSQNENHTNTLWFGTTIFSTSQNVFDPFHCV